MQQTRLCESMCVDGHVGMLLFLVRHSISDLDRKIKQRLEDDAHMCKHTHTHVYVCSPPVSRCLFISLASAVASRLESVHRETRVKREHCSVFYLHQVIRHMQLVSLSRINMCWCAYCMCVCLEGWEYLCAVGDRLYGMHLGWPDAETRRGCWGWWLVISSRLFSVCVCVCIFEVV